MSHDQATPRIIDYLQGVHGAFLPQQILDVAADQERFQAYEQAIAHAVTARSEAAVLHVGLGAGLLSLVSAGAGASRVTICERWPRLADIDRALGEANGFGDRIRVIEKRPTELAVGADRLGEHNVLVLDCIDCGLLGSGIAATLAHARRSLISPDAAVIPAGATVFAMLIELRTGDICGFDLSAFNRYRWNTGYEPIRLGAEDHKALTAPFACLDFDFGSGIDAAAKTIEVRVERAGLANAVVFWFELRLDERRRLRTGPIVRPSASWPAALQYLDRELSLKEGSRLSIEAAHDTERIVFRTLEPAATRKTFSGVAPAVPHWHFPMLADKGRNQAYEQAIARAVAERPDADVLDIGTGTGLLAMMAARAGAKRVTACEVVPHLAQLARQIVHLNGWSGAVTIAGKHSSQLCVPTDLPRRAGLLVSEIVDHSLLGEGLLPSLVHARAELLDDAPILIPARAVVYAVGVEIYQERLGRFDVTPLNLLRLSRYMGLDLNKADCRPLTAVFEAFQFDFYQREFKPERRLFQVPIVRSGVCNAVAFWYDLYLDRDTVIRTSPGSTIAWEQAVNFFDTQVRVQEGGRLPIGCEHDGRALRFGLELPARGQGRLPTLPERQPAWHLNLVGDQQDVLWQAAELDEELRRMPAARANTALRSIAERAVQLGLDPSMVSDYMTQLGHHT